MNILKDIFNKIYSEKNIGTNLAILLSGLTAYYFYTKKKDQILILISIIITFSLSKIIISIIQYLINIIIKKIQFKILKKEIKKQFSSKELSVINEFIEGKTSIISDSYLKERRIHFDQEGINSLIGRKIVWIPPI